MTKKNLKDILDKALKKLYEKDSYLLKNDCHERSITHKLAEYLQELLPDLNVDCEYNLDIDNDGKRKKWISPEVVEEIKKEIQQTKRSLNADNSNLSEEIEKLSQNFYPDIIVHKRGSNDKNILVIEAKKGTADGDLDIKKLKALTNQEGEMHYRYLLGARVILDFHDANPESPITSPIFYSNGKEE